MLIKILKNTTSEDILIKDTGINIAAMSSYTIDTRDYLHFVDSLDIVSPLDNGSIVVNNGTEDLSSVAGLHLIRILAVDDAADLSFNNADNDFVSDNVQDAIEEAGKGGMLDIITHERNAAGNKLMVFDIPSDSYLESAPEVVIDNNGNVVGKG